MLIYFPGLPRAAAWGKQGAASTVLHSNLNVATTAQTSTRPTRRGGAGTRQQRLGATASGTTETRGTGRERKGAVKASSQASSSRPATPASATQSARPTTPSTTKVPRPKEAAPPPPPPRSPTSSTLDSESGSASQEAPPTESPVRPTSTEAPAAPPGLPAVPPGLSAPPGLPPPSRTASTMSSPLSIHVQPSQSSYQMSTQAQALIEDLRARREGPAPSFTEKSPFPDFDRMLQTLSGDDGFSFNLDPALAGEGADEALVLPELDATPNTPFTGTFLDAFPGLRQNTVSSPLMGPPGLSHPSRPAYEPMNLRQPGILERQSSGSSGYTGSFNPFGADTSDDMPSRRYSPLDEERQVSRFTFARGRQGSTSSSLHASSPLNHVGDFSHVPFYNSAEMASPARRGTPPQWFANRPQPQDFPHGPHSAMGSPLPQHAQAQPHFAAPQQQPGRFQPFDTGVSEAQLRELINSSRERTVFRNGQSGRMLLLV